MKNQEDFISKIIKILVRNKSIEQNVALMLPQLFEKKSQESFEIFLIEEGYVEKRDLLKAFAEYFKVPSFDVVGYFFNKHLLSKFPKGFLLRNQVIPLEIDQNMLVVIAANPTISGLESSLCKYVSYDINFMVGLGGDICDSIKEFYDASIVEQKDFDKKETIGNIVADE